MRYIEVEIIRFPFVKEKVIKNAKKVPTPNYYPHIIISYHWSLRGVAVKALAQRDGRSEASQSSIPNRGSFAQRAALYHSIRSSVM